MTLKSEANTQSLLEKALLFSFVIHGIAMLSMALCLLPGMPGGGTTDPLLRIHYISAHPWRWRLGWLPWQLTAVSDLLIAAGLWRTNWMPKTPARITALLTIAAVIPDQAGQFGWVTRGIALAQSGSAATYLTYEARIFQWTAVWGATLYTAGALGWTWCFAQARVWSGWLTAISSVVWPLFIIVSIGPLMPATIRPGATFVAAGNAVGFVLLELWFALVTERVLRRSRPEASQGRLAPWHHPDRSLGRFLDPIANSRFLRALGEFVPVPSLRSDITDVIYVNYVVEAARLEPLVPAGLELLRIGPDSRFAVFTFLTFRHGHFGPKATGPFRRFMLSPVQTNWRIYVQHPGTGQQGVYFLTTACTSTLYGVGARLLAEAMPMHVLASATIRVDGDGGELRLDPGSGSAPDAMVTIRKMAVPPTSGPWTDAFGSWREMLQYVVPQDRALSTQEWAGRLTRQEISLDIPIEACEPFDAQVDSRAAEAIVGTAVPFCFRVPAVCFKFDSEEHAAVGRLSDPIPESTPAHPNVALTL